MVVPDSIEKDCRIKIGKIVDIPKCPLCNNSPKTITHEFVECQKSHQLWRQLEVWLGMVQKYNIKISDSEKTVGTAFKNSIIDTVILLTKKTER